MSIHLRRNFVDVFDRDVHILVPSKLEGKIPLRISYDLPNKVLKVPLVFQAEFGN